MKKTLTLTTALIALFALAACTTPVTTLKHPKTHKVVNCGGHQEASVAGGAIGYQIQKDKDAECVAMHKKKGYVEVTTDSK